MEMYIWNYRIEKMKCISSTVRMFMRKTGVTKYRKISSVWCWLSDPKVRLSAKILNKSNVSWCTYYWLEPKAADSCKDYMPAQAVWHECRHLSCQYSVTSEPASYHTSKMLEKFNLENLSVLKSGKINLFSVSRYPLCIVHCTFHQQPGRYNRIYPCVMTSGTVNVCSSLCKNVLLDVYTHPSTVTAFSVLPIAMGQIFKAGHIFLYAAF